MRKVRKNQFEVLDMHEMDKVDEDIDWGSNNGLSALWSLYYKDPTKTFVDSFCLELENVKNDEEAQYVSPRPRRLTLCN